MALALVDHCPYVVTIVDATKLTIATNRSMTSALLPDESSTTGMPVLCTKYGDILLAIKTGDRCSLVAAQLSNDGVRFIEPKFATNIDAALLLLWTYSIEMNRLILVTGAEGKTRVIYTINAAQINDMFAADVIPKIAQEGLTSTAANPALITQLTGTIQGLFYTAEGLVAINREQLIVVCFLCSNSHPLFPSRRVPQKVLSCAKST